jgi:hypothetical protein
MSVEKKNNILGVPSIYVHDIYYTREKKKKIKKHTFKINLNFLKYHFINIIFFSILLHLGGVM